MGMVVKLGARPLPTTGLRVRIQITDISQKIKNGRHKYRSGQHTVARQKNGIQKSLKFCSSGSTYKPKDASFFLRWSQAPQNFLFCLAPSTVPDKERFQTDSKVKTVETKVLLIFFACWWRSVRIINEVAFDRRLRPTCWAQLAYRRGRKGGAVRPGVIPDPKQVRSSVVAIATVGSLKPCICHHKIR